MSAALLAQAVQHAARTHALGASRTVQLATVVDASDLTLELMETRHVIHGDEVSMTKATRGLVNDGGLAQDDVVVLLKKTTDGAVHWVLWDVVADDGDASPGPASQIAALTARVVALEARPRHVVGAASLTWPAGSNWSNVQTVLHHCPFTPQAVVPVYNSSGAGLNNEIRVNAYDITATQFSAQAKYDPTVPGVFTTTFAWVAYE